MEVVFATLLFFAIIALVIVYFLINSFQLREQKVTGIVQKTIRLPVGLFGTGFLMLGPVIIPVSSTGSRYLVWIEESSGQSTKCYIVDSSQFAVLEPSKHVTFCFRQERLTRSRTVVSLEF